MIPNILSGANPINIKIIKKIWLPILPSNLLYDIGTGLKTFKWLISRSSPFNYNRKISSLASIWRHHCRQTLPGVDDSLLWFRREAEDINLCHIKVPVRTCVNHPNIAPSFWKQKLVYYSVYIKESTLFTLILYIIFRVL